MNLEAYTSQLTHELRPRTVVFLLKGDQVLLGYKKTGFGKGNYVGVGGKVEGDESIEEAAIREVQEETSITPIGLIQLGILRFYFPHVEDESWNQEVHAFMSNTWEGNPTETDELRPEWVSIDSIPFEQMWSDAPLWIPQVLAGQKVEGNFLFDEDLQVIEHQIDAISVVPSI